MPIVLTLRILNQEGQFKEQLGLHIEILLREGCVEIAQLRGLRR